MMRATVLSIGLLIAGCVPSRSSTFGPVASEVERRVGVRAAWDESTDPRVSAAVRELLSRPLTRDAAVRIAIAGNRSLQARYDELGIAAAAIASATVLAPTEVDLELKGVFAGTTETEISATQDILDLLQVGQRRGIAQADVAAARARAVAATVELVADVEEAFNEIVAAQQQLELRQTAFDAAAASAEVTERMHAAGNTPTLELARQRDQREQARIDLARAQADVEVAREHVNRMLGLSGEDTRWSAGGRLEDVPDAAPSLDNLEREAVTASLALIATRAEARSAAGRLGVARTRAWLPELGVGVAATRGAEDGDWSVGPALRIGLPIFNQQQGPRARAAAELRRSENLTIATAVNVRAQARALRQQVLEAHAEARHLKDVVLPLRQQVLDETLKQYNAMNATTFELLLARRELVDAGRQYIDALRRYHNATAVARALARGGLPDMPAGDSTISTGGAAPAEH